MLGLVAIGALIGFLVFHGISDQAGDISAKANKSLDKIQGWLSDAGADNPQNATKDAEEAAPEIRKTLLSGVATGLGGLKNLVFFLAFAVLSTLFVLKDGPVMHRFINRHLGVPVPVADVVTTNIAKSLRSYFLAVTIIAGFNAILIGGAALILGVPLAGTIAVVTIGAGALFGMVGLTLAAPLTSAAVHISNDLRGRGSDDPDVRVAEPAPSG